jgi:hypothetical protein
VLEAPFDALGLALHSPKETVESLSTPAAMELLREIGDTHVEQHTSSGCGL